MFGIFQNSIRRASCFFAILVLAIALFAPLTISLQTLTAEAQVSPTHTVQNTPEFDGDGSSDGKSAFGTLGAFIGETLLGLGAVMTRFGGAALEGAVSFVVIDMYNKSPQQTIDFVWKFVRDLCNLVFIFGFIYLGIRSILDPGSLDSKRWLSRIIIGALLINFSLYFSKVIVDIGNFTAVTIYNTGITSFSQGGNAVEPTISYAFIDSVSLTNIFGTPEQSVFENMTSGQTWTYYILGFIFLMLAGFVFLMAAVMLLTRFVTLILIMIASPLLFAAAVFPNTEKIANDLWRRLVASSLYPAVFFFLIFTSLKIVHEFKARLDNGDPSSPINALTGSNTGELSMVVIMFGLASLLLIQSIVISRRIAESGGGFGVDVMKKFHGNVQGVLQRTVTRTGAVAGYAAAWAPRKAARYAVSKTSEKALDKFDKLQASEKPGLIGGVVKRAVQLGDADVAIRAGLETGKSAKLGLKNSRGEETKIDEERNKRVTGTAAKMQRDKAVEDYNKAAEANTLTPELIEGLTKAIKGMSSDEIKDMDFELISKDHIAYNLSIKQIEKLQESGKYSDADIKKIKDAKESYATAIATGTVPVGANINSDKIRINLQEGLSRRGTEELAKMPVAVFTSKAMAPYITPAMIQAKMKDGTISKADIARIRDNIQENGNVESNVNQWETWAKTTYGAEFGLVLKPKESEKSQETLKPEEHKSFKQKQREKGNIK